MSYSREAGDLTDTINNRLRDEINGHRSKLCYFFLSAAGAAVAFATTQLETSLNPINLLSTILALMFWAFSFFWGWKVLDTEENHLWLQSNVQAEGKANGWDRNRVQMLINLASEKSRSNLEHYRQAQVWFLMLGAVVYALGYIGSVMAVLDI